MTLRFVGGVRSKTVGWTGSPSQNQECLHLLTLLMVSAVSMWLDVIYVATGMFLHRVRNPLAGQLSILRVDALKTKLHSLGTVTVSLLQIRIGMLFLERRAWEITRRGCKRGKSLLSHTKSLPNDGSCDRVAVLYSVCETDAKSRLTMAFWPVSDLLHFTPSLFERGGASSQCFFKVWAKKKIAIRVFKSGETIFKTGEKMCQLPLKSTSLNIPMPPCINRTVQIMIWRTLNPPNSKAHNASNFGVSRPTNDSRLLVGCKGHFSAETNHWRF